MPIGDNYASLPDWKPQDAKAEGLPLLASRATLTRVAADARRRSWYDSSVNRPVRLHL